MSFIKKVTNILLNKPAGDIWEKLFNKKILIALSGGKDSVVLLDYMLRYREVCGWQIIVCHVNHNLRGLESTNDENFCIEFCAKSNTHIIVRQLDISNSVDAKTRGIEYSARAGRYKVLQEVAQQYKCDYISTAHTFDDQNESFFVDMLTGCSVFTIGGISDFIYNSGANIVRPFLNASSSDILDYIKINNLRHIEDSSNNNINFVRNRVRSKMIPLLAKNDKTIFNSIHAIQKQSVALNSYLDRLFKGITGALNITLPDSVDTVVTLNKDYLSELTTTVRHFLFGKIISHFFRCSRVHIGIMDELLGSSGSKRVNFPDGYICETTPKYLKIYNEALIKPFTIIKQKGILTVDLHDGRSLVVGKTYLNDILIIRNRRSGDRINGKKIKELYYNKSIGYFDRERALIIEQNGLLIWAEHISANDPDRIAVI